MAVAAHRYDLVVVANRLPVDRIQDDEGNVSWSKSPGGLVTAMDSPAPAGSRGRSGSASWP